MIRLEVDLGSRSYPILIGRALLEQPGLVASQVTGRKALLVTNETVMRLHGARLLRGLDGVEVDVLRIAEGEAHKTLQTFASILDRLIERRHSRATTVIAFGGGVIGDVAGFAAACYQRGVALLQVPTTLLAQVDSSVGGKTAINHALGKNLIGAFHQPRMVIADTTALDTLPPREVSAGIAEIVKYGVIRDPLFFAWLEEHMPALVALDAEAVAHAVARSCEIKAEVVSRDERESGLREILNLGHTFGHAIESLAGYGTWLHGEAVAAGIVLAADLSARIGWLSPRDARRIERLLAAAGLPVAAPTLPIERWLAAMGMDKKAADGRIRLVLIRALGDVVVTDEFAPEALAATLAAGDRQDAGR